MAKDERTKKQIKMDDFLNELKATIVTTEIGKFSMYNLLYDVGLNTKIKYFNIVAAFNKKENRFYERKKTFDYGFIFKNGCEIRGVKSVIFNSIICSNPIIDRRERIPKFKSVSATPIPFTY